MFVLCWACLDLWLTVGVRLDLILWMHFPAYSWAFARKVGTSTFRSIAVHGMQLGLGLGLGLGLVRVGVRLRLKVRVGVRVRVRVRVRPNLC